MRKPKPCTKSKNQALNIAVEVHGGRLSDLATLLGVSGTAVTGIMRRGFVSDDHAVRLEAYTGLSRWRFMDPRIVAHIRLAFAQHGVSFKPGTVAPGYDVHAFEAIELHARGTC